MKASGVLLLLLVLCVVYATARRVEYKRGQGEIKSMRLGAGFGTPLYGRELDAKSFRSKPTEEQVEQMRSRAKNSEKRQLSSHSKPTVQVDLIKSVTSTKIKLSDRVQMSESVREKWNITSAQQKKNYWDGYDDDYYPFNSAPLITEEDRYTFPYSTIGLVVVWHQVNTWVGDEWVEWEAVFSCTGTVVGPSMVLTESLCAVSLGERVTFYPSWKFSSNLCHSFEGTSLGVWEAIWGYAYGGVSRGFDYDEFGLLVIERKTPTEAPAQTYTVGSQTGWLGLTLGSHYDVHSLVGYNLNPLWFLFGPRKRGGPTSDPITTIISDLKVSQAVPSDEGIDGALLFPTDMITFGSPMILNLGPADYDFDDDEGLAHGRLTERNLVAGVVSTYGSSGGPRGFGFGSAGVAMRPFGDEFAAIYSELCQDFCWACAGFSTKNITHSQGPARPTGDAILSTPEFYVSPGGPDRRADSQPKRSAARLPTVGHKASSSLITRHTVKVSEHLARSFSNSSTQEKNSIIADGPFSSSPIIVASNRFQFPYSALGKIFTFEDDDLVAHCTGAVVGPRLVVAAPQCLRPAENTQYRWEFYPAWQQLSFDSNELLGTSLGMFEGEAAYTNDDHFAGYYSSNAGILVTKVASDPKFSWRTYNVGGVTGWFGLDFSLGDLDMRYNLMTQAAYSESHFPGRIQVATTPHGGYGSVDAPTGAVDTAVYGYYTDILRTAGVPTIINFGPLNREILDIGEYAGEYTRRNVLSGLGGIPNDQVTSEQEVNSWTQPFGPWFYDMMDGACSHCEACGDLTDPSLGYLLATGPAGTESNELLTQCIYNDGPFRKSLESRGIFLPECCLIGKRFGVRSERGLSCCLERGPIGIDECDFFPFP